MFFIAIIVALFVFTSIITIIAKPSVRESLKDSNGKPVEKESLIKVCATAAIISIIFLGVTCPDTEEEKAQAEIRKHKLKIDACSYELAGRVSVKLLDPDSMKITSKYWVPADSVKKTYVHTINFTGTNAFGGRIPGSIVAEMDENCNIIKVIDTQGL